MDLAAIYTQKVMSKTNIEYQTMTNLEPTDLSVKGKKVVKVDIALVQH